MPQNYCLEISKLELKGTFTSLSLFFPKNTVTCIVGRSGAGKSALIKAILDRKPSVHINPKHLCLYTFIHLYLCPHLTLVENLILYFSRFLPLDFHCEISVEMIKSTFHFFKLDYCLNLYPHQLEYNDLLSYELISMACLPANTIVVLDEPLGLISNNLIKNNLFVKFISFIKKRGDITVIYSTNRTYQMPVADRIVVLDAEIRGVKKILTHFPHNNERKLLQMIYEQ